MEIAVAKYLVVEDQPWVARVHETLLAEHGVAVIVPTFAAARLALEEGGPWAGFLIDDRLPDGSGLRLLPSIREKYPHVPVLVVSAAVDGHLADASFDHRASCMGKPLTEERLRRFLAEWAPMGCGKVERTLGVWGTRYSII